MVGAGSWIEDGELSCFVVAQRDGDKELVAYLPRKVSMQVCKER